uniref:Uncharacterized protein n=1 Tax=Triticum urartu TaxID=4572 RepID=A0A8R7PER4_TRIUA
KKPTAPRPLPTARTHEPPHDDLSHTPHLLLPTTRAWSGLRRRPPPAHPRPSLRRRSTAKPPPPFAAAMECLDVVKMHAGAAPATERKTTDALLLRQQMHAEARYIHSNRQAPVLY